MKRIITNGITNLEPLPGSSEWHWGADYASNDLYEAEELFRSGHPIRKNRLFLVRCPEGTVYEPVRTKPGVSWKTGVSRQAGGTVDGRFSKGRDSYSDLP